MSDILIGILVVMGIILLWFTIGHRPTVVAPDPESGVSTVIAPIVSRDFSEVGTLVFYPNNVMPVPYLYYQDANSKTVSKALVFSTSPPANFSSWSGAHISVTGILDSEHVTVTDITYLSGP